MSPLDKKGRVHTSLLIVTVIKNTETKYVSDDEISLRAFRGSGPGGQKRNKTHSNVQALHIETGLTVTSNDRSQAKNKEHAKNALKEKVNNNLEKSKLNQINQERVEQGGFGDRGFKTRTIREKDGIVMDHRTGKNKLLKDYMRGHLQF